MAQRGTETFESKFESTLTTELRRQGLPNFEDVSRAIASSIKRVGLTGLVVDAAGKSIGDRGCVALVETLLKMMAFASSPPEWTVNLADNAFTDRVTGHLLLLIQRCAKLVSLDIANVDGLSVSSLVQLEDACAKAKSSGKSRLDLVTAPVTRSRGDSKPRSGSGVDVGHHSGTPTNRREPSDANSGVDIAALKRRRDSLLREEAQLPTQITTQPQTSAPAANSAPSTATKGPPARPSTASPQPRPESKRAASRSRTRSPTRGSVERDGKVIKGGAVNPVPLRSSSSNVKSKGPAADTAQVARTAAIKQFREKPNSARPLTKGAAAASKHPEPLSAKQLAAAFPASGDGNTKHRPVDVDSVCTTATEVPDEQDYLDITANMNPMIDNMVSLENQGVPPDVLFRRLQQALVAPQGAHSFASVTVLHLASNKLSALDGRLLPSSLLRVDLSDNQLAQVPNFSACPMLAVVNLRRNRLRSIGPSFEGNLNIGHLFLGRNELSFIDGIGHLWVLETLDLSCNRIVSQAQLRPLSLNSSLRHVILRGNPIETNNKAYRAVLRNLVPSLIAVDNERLVFSRTAEARLLQDQRTGHEALSPRPTSQKLDTVGSPQDGRAALTGYAVRNMLSKGISGMALGYSEKHSVHASKKRIVNSEQQRRTQSESTRQAKGTSRKDIMAKLCEQSKRFLEKTIVERLTTADRRRDLEGLKVNGQPDAHLLDDEDRHPSSSDQRRDSRSSSQPADEHVAQQPNPQRFVAKRSASIEDDHLRRNSNQEAVVANKGRSGSRPQSPSPVPDRPPSDAQRAVDELLGGGSRGLPVHPSTSRAHKTQQHQEDRVSLAYRPTASSLERVRSRSQSNASSRSPSPHVTEGTAVLAVHNNEPLSAALKRVNTPHRAAQDIKPAAMTLRADSNTPTLLARTRRPSAGQKKRAEPYDTPSRSLLYPTQTLTSPYADSEEIVLSPEGASALSPPGLQGKQVSPIRSALDMTDLSADGQAFADRIVPRMDPGPPASPLPRSVRAAPATPIARQRQVGARQPILSPSADEQRRATTPDLPRSAHPETPPLHRQPFHRSSNPPAAPPPAVQNFVEQFHADLRAVQMSLRTVVDLIWSSLNAPNADAALSLAEERARCLEIVAKSRMLDDTELPVGVVRFFGFRTEELNDPRVAQNAAENDDSDRGAMLEAIHEMGSSKTCLRYLVALVDGGRDDLLRRYVEGIKVDLYDSR